MTTTLPELGLFVNVRQRAFVAVALRASELPSPGRLFKHGPRTPQEGPLGLGLKGAFGQ